MKKSFTIQFKLISLYLITTTLVLILMDLFLSSTLKSYLIQQIKGNLTKELTLIKGTIEERFPERITSYEVDDFAKLFGKSLHTRVTIVDRKGKVLGDSDLQRKRLPEVENHLDRPEIQKSLTKGYGESIRYSTTLSTSMLYLAKPLNTGGKISGAVRLALPLHDVDRIISNVHKFIYLASLLALAFALFLTIVVSSIISRPIREMARTARKMVSGDLAIKTQSQTSGELKELADALNFLTAELKEKIRQLTSEKSQLQAILKGMLEGVMVTDEKGKVVLINKSLEEIFSIEDSAIGKTPLELVRRGELQEAINTVLNENNPLTIRLFLFLPEVKELEVNLVSFEFEDGRRGVVAVFHDITKLVMLERVRKDFVANVSHELRTPLTAIKGYTETLLEGEMQDQSQLHEFLKVISNHAERLSLIVQDLLSLSQIDSADFRPSFQPVSLRKLGEKIVGMMTDLASKKAVTITLNIPEDIPEIPADEPLLEQALLNLLDNAVKYNREGGTVSLSAMLKDSEVEVRVTDTGIGIGSEHLPRIFERFYRVDKGRSREMGGTGLGLSIVKNIIEKHGGRVWAESELNEGSTFFFTLPTA
jgi:two-component system phosphate regulon sensor histidine kinase PhoR